MASDPTLSPAAVEGRRVSRQRKIVIGLGITFLGLLVFLAAPDLTGPLTADLPYLAVALVSLYAGGILLGVALGERRRPG
ncbi:MAG: hypothetical protein L3K00_08640 [Thermoplasmata archaeon]|nr:hypothetical protein [Thermoplasmata archaeon]